MTGRPHWKESRDPDTMLNRSVLDTGNMRIVVRPMLDGRTEVSYRRQEGTRTQTTNSVYDAGPMDVRNAINRQLARAARTSQ